MARRATRTLASVAMALSVACQASTRVAPSPDRGTSTAQGAVDDLLAADRAFAAAARSRSVVDGLTAMMADDVYLSVPPATWAEGVGAVRAALSTNPDNLTSRADWYPIRGGVSADGQHGFTFGYITIRKPDGSAISQKYLAYWIKGATGWRVATLRRGRSPSAATDTAMMVPALPSRMVPVNTDARDLAAIAASLKAAEQAFSDEAQVVGLGPAFAKFGSADAVNMGGADSPHFVVGASRIGAAVGGDDGAKPSPVNWNADRVLVASSGDLGVTFGRIRANADKAAPGQPFFTVWRRLPGQPWRYIAE